MWILYQIAFVLVLLLAAPVLLLRRGSHYLPTLRGRLGGHRGRVVRGGLWLHAVSVGEVGVAATLARALPEDLPLLVTTVTPTGQERARTLFAERPATSVAYLPFDLGFSVSRFLNRFRPRALVLVEGDYWPLLLSRARRRGLPLAVVNGRVGDTNARRLARLGPFTRPLFDPVDRFGVQGHRDLERLVAAGVAEERVRVTGNLKYESPPPEREPALEQWVLELAAGRPVLLAGSTMEGEEPEVVEAFRRAGGGDRALLVLAPRHPERWGEVARFLEGTRFRVRRRSRFDAARSTEQGTEAEGRPDVLLLDSLGELAGLYALAAGAFIGGTLVPTGGHNPLEAARFGVPVVVGPSMENFRDMAAEFDREAAWVRVGNPQELGRVFRRWLDDPSSARALGARGEAVVERNRGALERTLDLLSPLLERVCSR